MDFAHVQTPARPPDHAPRRPAHRVKNGAPACAFLA
jgi:hypothetical protein